MYGVFKNHIYKHMGLYSHTQGIRYDVKYSSNLYQTGLSQYKQMLSLVR